MDRVANAALLRGLFYSPLDVIRPIRCYFVPLRVARNPQAMSKSCTNSLRLRGISARLFCFLPCQKVRVQNDSFIESGPLYSAVKEASSEPGRDYVRRNPTQDINPPRSCLLFVEKLNGFVGGYRGSLPGYISVRRAPCFQRASLENSALENRGRPPPMQYLHGSRE